MTISDNDNREPPFSEEELAELWPFDEPWPFNDEDGVEDEEELDMLRSFERGKWVPTSEDEAVLKRHMELFREARKTGNYGPVDYDKPYPWSKTNHQGKSAHLAGNDVTGDNPPENETP